MVFWILYTLSFFLLWFENKLIVLPITKRPVIFTGPYFQFLLWISRLFSQYGSIAGLWYVYNLSIAIVAFAVIYAFGKITFKVYFNREISWTATYLAELIREEAKNKGERLNDAQIYQQAQKEAYDTVVQNMNTGGRGF